MFERADTEGYFYIRFEYFYMILAKRLSLDNLLNFIFKKFIRLFIDKNLI